MELVFPWVLYIGLAVVIILPFVKFKNRDAYKKGNKVAGVGVLTDSPLYKRLMRRYRVISTVVLFTLLAAVLVCFVLMSRPAKVETVNEELRNRDIFLCMDISSSVDKLNLDICGEIKELVKELDGERLGITIFNAKSVLMVPLTTDYNYVLSTVEKLEEAFEFSIAYDEDPSLELDLELFYYKYEGTLADEGSSFIGDGLASTLFNFPDLDENTERSRMIIFTTDNQLNGTPVVTVDEAAALCKEKDVKVFAVAPDNVVDESSFMSAIESTGGKYYRASEKGAFDSLLSDIEDTETSLMWEVKTIVTDKPEVLVITLTVLVGLYFVLSKSIKL